MYKLTNEILFKLVNVNFSEKILETENMMILYYSDKSGKLYEPIRIDIENIDWIMVDKMCALVLNIESRRMLVNIVKLFENVVLPEGVTVDGKDMNTEDDAKKLILCVYDTILTRIYSRLNVYAHNESIKNKNRLLAKQFCNSINEMELKNMLNNIQIGSNIKFIIDELLKGYATAPANKIRSLASTPGWDPGVSSIRKLISVYKNVVDINEWIDVFPDKINDIKKIYTEMEDRR